MIETAEPHTYSPVYVWATATAFGNGVWTIQVKGMCRDMYLADCTPGLLY
ncbi:hypothetical protein [Paraburkholderia strydomiana]